jgi:hypothetical protein
MSKITSIAIVKIGSHDILAYSQKVSQNRQEPKTACHKWRSKFYSAMLTSHLGLR